MPPNPHNHDLARLADLAYQRELGHHLAQLLARFDEWREGRISASELNGFVHEYHQGPARSVWSRHESLRHADKRVAWGLAQGMLHEHELDPAVLELVRDTAAAFRALGRE